MRVSVPEKVLRVALGVALVFMLLPINTGNRFLDLKTHDEAEAAVPIVPIATVFFTALAAYGVYAAGTTTEAHNANVQSLYGEFITSSGMNASDVEAMLSGAVTSSGNIDLGYLTNAGFFGLVPAFVSNLVSSGQANSGENSNSVYTTSVILGEHEVRTVAPSEIPYYEAVDVSQMTNTKCIGSYTGSGSAFIYFGANVDSINFLVQSRRCIVTTVDGSSDSTLSMCRVYFNDSGEVTDTEYQNNVECYLSWSKNPILTNSYSYTANGAGTDVVNSDNGMIASVSSGVLDGTAAIPDTTVEPFEPTAEQLEAGYSSADIVEAINSGTGEISSDTTAISQGVEQIKSNVATIEGIWSGLQSTPFGWLASFFASVLQNWTSLLDMLGSTPLSTLLAPLAGIGTIAVALTGAGGVLEWMGNTTIGDLFQGVTTGIAGVAGTLSGIDDWLGTAPLSDLWGDITGIATGVTGVLAGVNDVSSWWGTLSGWWEGLNTWLGVDGLTLEGVLEGVLSGTLAGTLADVIAAIQTGVLDIAGAIEGIRFPDPPRPDPEPGTDTVDIVGLPTWPQASIDAKLEEKAPFCYVVAMNQAFDRARGTYNDNPSFYYELNVPFAGDIRFDAGPWLNYSVNGFTIAWLLRVAFNAFMIALLLTFVYKGMQRVLSGD